MYIDARDKTGDITIISKGEIISTTDTIYCDYYTVDFSPNGKYLAVSDIPEIYDVETGKLIHILDDSDTNSVGHTAFSPDNKYLATSTWRNIGKIWDVETGEKIKHIGYQIQDPVFSSSGEMIAYWADNDIHLVETISG